MLYVNVYLVGRAFGGKEEGSWYYDVGTPLASVPIVSRRGQGQSYFIQDGKINLCLCEDCQGTKLVPGECESEDPYVVDCQCSHIPIDIETTEKIMANMQELFAEEVGRYERLCVALESDFAQPFPQRTPTYE